MRSVISAVILPGQGYVCPECFTRGHVAGFPLATPETYTFAITDPPAQLEWDVAAARAMIAARPRPPHLLDPTWLLPWLVERSSFTREHLDHIPDHIVEEPGVIVEIVAGPPGSEPAPFRILIDGIHRLARRLLDGRTCWAYLLRDDEQRSIRSDFLHDRRAEALTITEAGVADRDAATRRSCTGGAGLA